MRKRQNFFFETLSPKNSKIFIFIIILIIKNSISTQTDYFGAFTIDYDQRNYQNTTVVLTNVNDIGDCSCDITQNTCDYLCCCDQDCPQFIIGTWLNNTNNVCLDKQNSRNQLFTYCFNDNLLYKFNRKRGMQEYRDTLSNLFCVTFDNSSVKDKFYSSIKSLNDTLIDSIFKYYIDPQFKDNYYNSITDHTYDPDKFYYESNDFLRVKYYNINNTLLIKDKFYLFNIGPFGECIQTEPIRYMKNIHRRECGKIFKKFSQCANLQWNNLLSNNLTFFAKPTDYPGKLLPKINKIYLRDYDSQNLTEFTGSISNLKTMLNFTDNYPNKINCLCSNVLEEMSFNFLVDEILLQVKDVIIDVILATNIKSKCDKRYSIKQAYSAIFSKLSNPYIRSGNPGYLIGSKLNVLRTIGTPSKQFQFYKDGFYLNGRNSNGTCVFYVQSGNIPIINSDFDVKVKFGVNNIYSCTKNLTFTEFNDYCKNNKWKDLLILNIFDQIESIGIYGASNLNYKSDWTKIIKNVNFTSTNWKADNRTCTIPTNVNLDILYSKGGYFNNRQYFVSSAKIYNSYEDIKFNGNPEIENKVVTVNLLVNYIYLGKNKLEEEIENPSILPLLPKDIVTPFTNELDQ